jgi:nucleotide-binding universal stress UspA family protein
MQVKLILAPVAGTAVDPDVVRVVTTLAKMWKAQVVLIHVIEVRWNMPLDAVLDADTERGETILDQATRLAEQSGVKVDSELVQARDAAAAIVDTARDRNADLIVLGMPYRKRMGRVHVGKTVVNVYTAAHCAVLAYRQEETAK